MRLNHAPTLESLAAEHCRCPLTLLEWFLEVAESHEHAGMSREYAERAAVADIAAQLAGVSASAVSQTQRVGTYGRYAGAP